MKTLWAFVHRYRTYLLSFGVLALVVGAFFFGGYYRYSCYYPFCSYRWQNPGHDVLVYGNNVTLRGQKVFEDASRYGDLASLQSHGEQRLYYATQWGQVYDLSVAQPRLVSEALLLSDEDVEQGGGVRGLVVAESDAGDVSLYMWVLHREHSEHQEKREQREDCWRVVVLSKSITAPTWRRIYAMPECIAQARMEETHQRFEMAGGRIQAYGSQLLISIGGFALATDDSADTHRGKIIIMNRDGSDARIFAQGLRNPQGLLVMGDGTIYESEHGEQGGDEVNRIVEGGHYGYPYRSYSVPYGGQAWPNNRKYPASDYREPLFSFGVSPGVSDMTHVRLPEIDGWEDVVLLGSLVGQSLFRLVIKEERVVLFEALEMDYRLRALEFVGEHIYVKVDQYYSPSAIYRFDVRYKH